MPARKKSIPSYLHHKPSNQAYVKIRRPDGSRQTVYLGPWDSSESKAEYARLLKQDQPARSPDATTPEIAPVGCITVSELILRFMEYASTYYRRMDGTLTNEVVNFRHSLRALRFLFGGLPADQFGPKCLKAVRSLMVEGYDHPEYGPHKPGSRKVVNQRINRIRHVFKWATSEELLPVSVWHQLTTVSGLKAGRCTARETTAIRPVTWEDVQKVVEYLNPVVKAMVLFSWFTGCRPGEACSLKACEIDRSGDVWFYRPTHHKLAYRGKPRVIAIGRQGQAVLEPFLDRDGCIFSPAHAQELRYAVLRAERKTPVQPSQMSRKKDAPRRTPGEAYTVESFNRAIARACRQASMPPWHANRLRHSFATRVRAEVGLEAAQVVLGHSSADVTQIYAERNLALAEKVAEAMG